MVAGRYDTSLSPEEFDDRCLPAIQGKFPVEIWGEDHDGNLRRIVFRPSLNPESFEIEGEIADDSASSEETIFIVTKGGTVRLYHYVPDSAPVRRRKRL